jgi:oligopeptide/dipeptide ABC transporter ATP-binding protein
MSTELPLLSVRGLDVVFRSGEGEVRALDGISFTMGRGEAHGLVGESGCGQSTLALSIMRLIRPPGRIEAGEIRFAGLGDLLTADEAAMRRVRGREIGMVFQDPASALNPLLRVATQIIEIQLAHRAITSGQAFRRSVELLKSVGIADPEARMRDYPHQLSGGMKQRVCIAIALSCDPTMLIADEPTTALDVTVQAQIVDLLRARCTSGSLSLLVISHDLGVVARLTDRISILYAGSVVEQGPTREVLRAPSHPYTGLLLRSRPRIDQPRVAQFTAIPGSAPIGVPRTDGCSFAPRCPRADQRCHRERPPIVAVNQGHQAACWHAVPGGPA